MIKQTGSETLLGSYRILDLTNEQGYFCSKLLGDLGADVIKIEKPSGDSGRQIGPFYKDIVEPEKSLYWMYYNTNKRGITLDIEKDEGIEIFKILATGADFVIESFHPGYMAGLGLDYNTISDINPKIIVTSITHFGQTGPHSDFQGADIVVWAMGSSMAYTGRSDRPARIGAPQGYILGGLHAAAGSMLAHYYREVTGEGQHVDVSMQQACISSWIPGIEIWHLLKLIMPRSEVAGSFGRPEPHGIIKTRYIWPCKDGYICMHLLGGANKGQAQSSTELTKWAVSEGMALELKDYDWSQYDSSTISQEERERLENIIISFLQTKTKKELHDAAREKNIFLLPSSNVKEIFENPQPFERAFWVDLEHSDLGDTLTYPGPFLKLNNCPLQVSRRAPRIGEHNDVIYRAELGFSADEINTLKNANVI